MPRVQRPSVVLAHEVPVLARQPDRVGVSLDVSDGTPNLFRMVEEHFPPAADGPHRMRWQSSTRSDQTLPAAFLQGFAHLFGAVLVFAHDQMDVVRHDRAGVTGVALSLNDFLKGSRRLDARRLVEDQCGMSKDVGCLLVELPDRCADRLNALASVVQLPQRGDHVGANGLRPTPARVVRKPVAVSGPDQVIGDHKWVSHKHLLLAACGLAFASSRAGRTFPPNRSAGER